MFTTGPGSPSVLQNRKFGFVETKTVQSPGGFAVALTSELVFAPSSSETSPAVNEDASTGPPASRPLSWGSSVDVSEGLGEGFKMLMLGGEDDAISSAISAFGDSSAAKPTHAHNHGYLLARQQRFAEADRSFSETMRTEAKGGSAKTMFHLASLKQLYLNEEATDPAEKARHLEDAAELYIRGINLRTTYTTPSLFNLAALRFKQGATDCCEHAYRTILAIDARHVDARLGLALVRSMYNDHQTAATLLEEAVKIQPANELALWRLGTVQRLLKRNFKPAFSRVRGGEFGFAGRTTALFLCTYNAFAPLLPRSAPPSAHASPAH
ncbi:hypothetical protein T484DRAFT_2026697, partial [Baffinella frigidus]